MRLVLVRHGAAIEGDEDDARPLSPRGRSRLARVVKGLGRLGLALDRIVHSPKLRALETAQALTPLLQEDGTTEVLDDLADPPAHELMTRLEGYAGTTCLVGHEPFLSLLLSWLVVGDRAAAWSFELKKGGVAVLEGEPRPGGMRLTMLLTPRVSRRLT